MSEDLVTRQELVEILERVAVAFGKFNMPKSAEALRSAMEPPAPKRHVLWTNCYSGEGGDFLGTYPTRADADAGAGFDRIACICVEFTEGEGL